MIGLTTFLIGLVADLIGFNRQLIEMTLERVTRMELGQMELRREFTPTQTVDPAIDLRALKHADPRRNR